jgi:MYXO-CTERM domain-containing protein
VHVTRALVAIAVLACASPAHAFPTGLQFDANPLTNDGAGGVAFDGAPRWTAHTCAVCHTDAPGTIDIRVEADDPTLFTDGWKKLKQYHLRVLLLNEHAGLQYQANGDACGTQTMPYAACNNNGFALEMDDANGKAIGAYAVVANGACAMGTPPGTDARVLMDGTAVTHNGAHHAIAQWDVCWTAPDAGAGTITAYVAVVDGNGGDGTPSWPEDTIGDDVAAGAVPLVELGAAPPPPQSGGCATTRGRGDDGALVALAIAALYARKRRRRTAALVAALALGGCRHVSPSERETLAKRSMKFSADPVEDQLDLHMQEAREGSAGGYGSSGGGCGCN